MGSAADGYVLEFAGWCGEGCWCWKIVSYWMMGLGREGNVPAGRMTLERSHSASVFLNSSYTTAGRSCLGISAAIESMVCVGAARRVAGARDRMRLRVDVVKIIFGYRLVSLG